MKNILKDMEGKSDLLWAWRQWEPVQTNSCRLGTPPPRPTAEQLLRIFTSLNDRQDTDEDDLLAYERTRGLINEIKCSYSLSLIRCLGIVFSKLLKRFYSGVFVNDEVLLKVKSVMGNSPVVFLPTHRSYCDFIIMAFVCFAYEVEIPCVAAAIDFSSMKVIGNLLRDCKAFFIRRNFNTDALYKRIFQCYLQYLIINGNSPIEFFIEGMRSRSGKAVVPKYGLLKTVLDTFTEKDVPDIILVPIGISYDRVLEDKLFSYELLGIPKPRESTKGFFKAIATMDENYGNIFINFGEPIYLKSFFMKSSALSCSADSGDILETLGFHIIRKQLKLQKICCIHLISLILHDHYMKNGCAACKLEDISSYIELLKCFVEAHGADVHINNDLIMTLNETLSVNKSLFLVVQSDVLLNNQENIDINVYDSKLKGAKLKNEILNASVPILQLQQYINPVLSVLTSPAFLVLIIQCNLLIEYLMNKYIFFRNIFLNEFIFMSNNAKEEFDGSLKFLCDFNVIKKDCNKFTVNENCPLSFTLSSVLYPFLVSYQHTCEKLLCCSGEIIVDDIVKQVQLSIQDKILKKKFSFHHSSLSLDTLHQAIQSLLRLQLISKVNRNGIDVVIVKNSILLLEASCEIGNLLRHHHLFWNKLNGFKFQTLSKL